MKPLSSLHALLLLAMMPPLLALGAGGVFSEEIPAATESKPVLNLKVLDSVEVRHPDRSVFYQRVAPPTAPPRRTPAPVPVAQPLSLEETAAQEARASKQFEVLMIFATVYDRRVTELRWSVGEHQYRAWSSIDFNDFAGTTEIETSDTVYLLILGLGNDTAEAVEAANKDAAARGLRGRKELPVVERFHSKRSGYLLADAEREEPPPEALAPLDALHIYYDANRERLHEEAGRRTAERLANEQALKEHPPKPKDTVIRFWPKRSRVYPTTGQ